MNVVRSLLFTVLFIVWSTVCFILTLPLLFAPRKFAIGAAQIWMTGFFWLSDNILNLSYRVIDKERLNASPVILASKHQSAWETLAFFPIFANPAIALKRELLWIPIFGLYLMKFSMIPLTRSKKHAARDLKNLLKAAEEAIGRGQSILIFPEGTRVKPGQKGNYHSGVASLYLHLNIPVIPIAHDSGVYWPRRGFVKKPGEIKVKLLDPIQPGLTKHAFMQRLEESIETATNNLIKKD